MRIVMGLSLLCHFHWMLLARFNGNVMTNGAENVSENLQGNVVGVR